MSFGVTNRNELSSFHTAAIWERWPYPRSGVSRTEFRPDYPRDSNTPLNA